MIDIKIKDFFATISNNGKLTLSTYMNRDYYGPLSIDWTQKERLNAGQKSIIQEWVGQEQSEISAKMISEAYDLGDHLAVEVMHETGRILGYGLSNVINLLNPEVIIVGGGMSAAGDRLLKIVRETTDKHALKLSNQACKIQQAQLGGRAGMIGAATYANERLKLI